MKYLVILGDGMADEPIPELGGRTPLEEARTPHMDRIARDGCCGLLRTIPDGCEAGSDIANLSILGYDPRRFYTGRGPLEAASMGIPLKASDMAYRCNLSTVKDGVMGDFSAGHISSAEGASLLAALDREISPARVYPGVSYRNILVLPEAGGRPRFRHTISSARRLPPTFRKGTMPPCSRNAWRRHGGSLEDTP